MLKCVLSAALLLFIPTVLSAQEDTLKKQGLEPVRHDSISNICQICERVSGEQKSDTLFSVSVNAVTLSEIIRFDSDSTFVASIPRSYYSYYAGYCTFFIRYLAEDTDGQCVAFSYLNKNKFEFGPPDRNHGTSVVIARKPGSASQPPHPAATELNVGAVKTDMSLKEYQDINRFLLHSIDSMLDGCKSIGVTPAKYRDMEDSSMKKYLTEDQYKGIPAVLAIEIVTKRVRESYLESLKHLCK